MKSTLICAGVDLLQKLKFLEQYLRQLPNARACFEHSNPMMQIRNVMKAVATRFRSHFRNQCRISYLCDFLAEHSDCCFAQHMHGEKGGYPPPIFQ